MDSKEKIFSAIKKNKPEIRPLPALPEYDYPEDLVDQFISSLASNGGNGQKIAAISELNEYLEVHFNGSQLILSLAEKVEGNYDIAQADDPHDLEHVEVAILKGEWGVAENAAIWLPEEKLSHRALPFIAQHLIVLLETDKLLGNMHEVYQKIDISASGYGVFIAGPSKTADIEQSLVIGAHGPRSMTVFLMD